MLKKLQLLRNVGQFENVTAGASLPLKRLSLVYAENGRGKTTLSAVLRSLATGDSVHLHERKRLASQHAPHVVIDCDGGAAAVFQNSSWSRAYPDLLIFDDYFVDDNVYSGLVVGADHRQKLHELILGAEGVALNARLQDAVKQIEKHNAALRTKADAIPAHERGNLSVDQFCALPERADIDGAILEAERALAASVEQDPIRTTPPLAAPELPRIDVDALERFLNKDLPSLEAAAAARVKAHVATLGSRSEPWLAQGVELLETSQQDCPFCAQPVAQSPVIEHYQGYFSAAYADLKRGTTQTLANFEKRHGEEVQAAFERSVRVLATGRTFWGRFTTISEGALDTAAIARDWKAARDVVRAVLREKEQAPLEKRALRAEERATIEAYSAHVAELERLKGGVAETNKQVALVKERAAASNKAALESDLARLRATRARHTTNTAAACAAYLDEKTAKATTEELREQAKKDLESYRRQIFPKYEAAINEYLARFNAGFRLTSVSSVDTRGGPSTTYNVVINKVAVAVGGNQTSGQPSFRTTLSAGDRNALALAFFFAKLDATKRLADSVVVIDDPMSSLDEHRTMTTIQEVRRLSTRSRQVIVLSHNKPFLCRLWESSDSADRASIEVVRDGVGSTLREWNVTDDCVSEYDRRHALLRRFVDQGGANARDVAQAIRPVLEGFLRVAVPEHFPPGTLLGPFRGLCQQRLGTPNQILDAATTQTLSNLTDYGNRFHHDTNPAWETASINDTELLGFVNQTLAFARKA